MRELLIAPAPVVIDPGTYRWRVGFANSDKPKSSFLTETSMLDGVSSIMFSLLNDEMMQLQGQLMLLGRSQLRLWLTTNQNCYK